MIALIFCTESLTDNEKMKSEKRNIPPILKLLNKHGLKATFFVSGRVAEKFPSLIKNISKKDHEIGSHSYNHVRLANLSLKKQRKEIRTSKEVLESLISTKVVGFIAPFLSFTNETLWILKKEGFVYDTSSHKPLEAKNSPIIELPCYLPDDFNIFESAESVGTEKEKIRKWVETRKKMIDSLKWYEVNVQLCHPWVISKNSGRLKALDIVIRYILNKNIDVKTCHEIINSL